MSDGETGSKKKGGWMKTAKELNDISKDFGVTPSDLRQMAAALAAEKARGATATEVAETIAHSPPETVVTADAGTHDPLAWVTDDLAGVYLVSRFSTISMRPKKSNLNPPLEGMELYAYARGRWRTNPFNLEHRDPEIAQNQRVMKANWHFHVLTMEFARDLWSDPRYPMPSTAVIDPEGFKGVSRQTKTAIGPRSPITDSVLRETLRVVLQRGAGSTYINTMHHGLQIEDPRIVNPYGNKLSGLGAYATLPAHIERAIERAQ